MNFVSTRNHRIKKNLSEAILDGLALDGGLYLPENIPHINLQHFATIEDYPLFANQVLQPFFAGCSLRENLIDICHNAFNFPIPIKLINFNTYLLELFHGPTVSFKDFGARFLAECMSRLSQKQTTIMVATSGDTGSAVAAAFYQKPEINVVILYPQGKISQRQEQQIVCWGDNVLAVAVKGAFDDCQRLVKEAFSHSWWQQNMRLSTANSINIGRLLPQIVYYAYTSLQLFRELSEPVGIIVPSGNLGNVTAAYLAKMMGFPIREIAIATNANRVLPDYLTTGHYQPRASIATLANAMDVGQPSNFERLSKLYPDFNEFKQNVLAWSVNDEEIRQEIKHFYTENNIAICPHTATAAYVRRKLSNKPWVIVATADASKFETVIEPLIHYKIPIPLQLEKLLSRQTHSCIIDPDSERLINTFRGNYGLS